MNRKVKVWMWHIIVLAVMSVLLGLVTHISTGGAFIVFGAYMFFISFYTL